MSRNVLPDGGLADLERVLGPAHLDPLLPAVLPLVVDDALDPLVAQRAARTLAQADHTRHEADGPDGFALGCIELDERAPFELDRWWFQQVASALGSDAMLTWMARRTGFDPGDAIELAGHALGPGDQVGWHDDQRRGQRLGLVWFASTDRPRGGELLLAPSVAPQVIEPIFNRLVIFDARQPHAVRRVTGGVRLSLVARTSTNP